MATLEENLFTLVTGNVGVAAVISTRMYPEALPQKPTLPAVRYSLVSAIPVNTHDKAGGLVQATVQLDACATTYAAARSLANTVKTAIDGYFSRSGMIRSVLRENENPAWDDDTGQKIVSIDYTVFYRET